jgi:hypothetical protein
MRGYGARRAVIAGLCPQIIPLERRSLKPAGSLFRQTRWELIASFKASLLSRITISLTAKLFRLHKGVPTQDKSPAQLDFKKRVKLA